MLYYAPDIYTSRHLPRSHLVILRSVLLLPLFALGFQLKSRRSLVAYTEIRLAFHILILDKRALPLE